MSYSKKENKVSDRIEKIIIDILKTIILEKEIDNMLQPKIVLAIIHIKNLELIQALKEFVSLIKM